VNVNMPLRAGIFSLTCLLLIGCAFHRPIGAGISRTYTVQAGDTVYDIAARFGVSAEEVLRSNSIGDPRTLQIGAVLQIPAGDSDGSPVIAELATEKAAALPVGPGVTEGPSAPTGSTVPLATVGFRAIGAHACRGQLKKLISPLSSGIDSYDFMKGSISRLLRGLPFEQRSLGSLSTAAKVFAVMGIPWSCGTGICSRCTPITGRISSI
jgi:murein DD-endopeptidase MepM/ murein hydrolase activator NlpD